MRILGDIGQALARILEADGGGVRVDELRDTEGVHLTYDIARLAESELYSQDTRGFDTGNINQSVTNTQTITDLPPVFSLLGIFVTSDASTRIASCYITADNIGSAGSLRDHLLWYWISGDAVLANPAGLHIGDWTGGAWNILAPAATQQFYAQGMPLTYQPLVKSRQGMLRFRIQTITTAFGAGTVRVTGHVVIGFFRRGRFLVAARPF